jgi:hypothetical protein
MAPEVKDRPGLDDPIWAYLLTERLQPYIVPAREWWANIDTLDIRETGVYELEGPPGFSMRFTRTAIRSPLRNIQAFPFVSTGYLQLTNIQGGALKMVERVCRTGLFIEEFTIVEKSNLPSTYKAGQFCAFIPTDIYNDSKLIGQWIYLTNEEMRASLEGVIPESVRTKFLLKL